MRLLVIDTFALAQCLLFNKSEEKNDRETKIAEQILFFLLFVVLTRDRSPLYLTAYGKLMHVASMKF